MPDVMACSACERVMPVTKLRYAGYDGWLCTGDETVKCYEILEERDLRVQPLEELTRQWPDNASDLQARSLVAARQYWQIITGGGGEIIDREWLGVRTPIKIRCPNGHTCRPLPGRVLSGKGYCRECGYIQIAESLLSYDTWAEFLRMAAEQNVTVKGEFRGTKKTVHIVCPAGHDGYPRPGGVIRLGEGFCKTCSRIQGAGKRRGYDTWAEFLRMAAEQNVTVKGEFRGTHKTVHILCPAGHDAYPFPSGVVGKKGDAFCIKCSYIQCRKKLLGYDTWAKFLRMAAEQNVTVKGEFRGAFKTVHIVCPAGHDAYPRPVYVVNSGYGFCAECRAPYSIFYVLSSSDGRVKFGITSGEPKRRLAQHRSNGGYKNIDFLVIGLPPGRPKAIEDRVKLELANAGYLSRIGTTEYFDDVTARGFIMSLIREIFSDVSVWINKNG